VTLTLFTLSGAHFFNVLVHVLAGLVGIGNGLRQLWGAKGDAAHRRFGKCLLRPRASSCWAQPLDCANFAFYPCAGLTLLVGWQLIGAWRLRQSDGCRKHLAANINIPSKGGVSRFG
jgi:hypothetical protein